MDGKPVARRPSSSGQKERAGMTPPRSTALGLPTQSPSPGSGEKNFSNLPSTPLYSSASAGLSFLVVMFGHSALNLVLTSSHFSSPLSRSEEHTSELQSLMRISYAVFCLKKKKKEQRLTRL